MMCLATAATIASRVVSSCCLYWTFFHMGDILRLVGEGGKIGGLDLGGRSLLSFWLIGWLGRFTGRDWSSES